MNKFLSRIALVLSLASVAHAQTCADSAVGGGAVTDALCQAAQPGGSAARAYVRVIAGLAGDCSGGADAAVCTLSEQADFDACCEVPMCDETDDNYDYDCGAGGKFVTGANAVPQDGTAGTCCEAKTAADCTFASQFFCAGFAAVGSSNDPCLSGTGATDACDTCTGFLNEPAGGFADVGGGAADVCGENTCTAMDVETAAAAGIVIDSLAGTEVMMSELAGKGVTAADGWTFTTMADAAVPVAATCTGTVTSTSSLCADEAAFIATPTLANCPTGDGCTFTRAASISCDTASGAPFTVTGAVGMTCTMPTSAPAGTVIANMACSNLQTGSITCSALHTCDAATHHPTSATLSIEGPDGVQGNSDDGVKCLSEGGELTLVVDNVARTSGEGTAAGCNINMCNPPTVPNGYTVGDDTQGTVAGLGDKTCEHGATDFSTTSQNWWSQATCTGDIDAGVEGKVAGATADCATWAPFVRTNQRADCPTGCAYDDTAATVTCTQATGESDTANEFAFTGCSQAKCNDISTDDDGAGGVTAFSTCSKGMTLKTGTDLDYACTSDTCDTFDCCVEDDGCAGDPCAGTNSACVDVPAPGVGNTCTCCDGSTLASLRDLATASGGCGGSIGYFGADVTSADAASSAAVVPVAGSCTACTPIANSAEADGTVDEADKMVTCTQADDSRAEACVTGAIHVDNSGAGVSDVCRLECPFTEVVALIDRLHIHTDGCAAVTLDGMTEGQQTVACEAVEGCFYTPCVSAAGAACTGATDDVAATCRPIYAACNAAGAANNQGDCDALAVKLSGADNVLDNSIADPPVVSADDVAACTFDTVDKCKYTPPEADYLETIQRCDALLATNWAHDLRDSCDATRACPLHGAISADPPGMIAMVKEVYTAAGAPPAGTDTWAAGDAPAAAGGNGLTELSGLAAVAAEAAAYFLNDGNANSMTDWEVCMNIRDAVLAAPTCSAGSGR